MLETIVSEMSLAERLARTCVYLSTEEGSAIQLDVELVQAEGITSVEQLIEVAGDVKRDVALRSTACGLLALLNERRATTTFVDLLREGLDDGLVWQAAKALARMRAPDAGPGLVGALQHGTPTQRSAAAWVLGWLRLPNTILLLRAAAADPNEEADVRGHALEALGSMQDKGAVQELIKLLSDASPEVRYWAAYALGQIGDPVCVPALERMVSTDVAVLPHGWSLRQEAVEALAAIRDRRRDEEANDE